jgi:hypothetical protein
MSYIHLKALSSEIECIFRQKDVFRGWRRQLVFKKLITTVIVILERRGTTYMRTFIITGTNSSPLHGRSPVHISRTIHPTLQMSTLTSYPFPLDSKISGAIQKIVPFMVVNARARLIFSTFFEIPKSEILHIPVVSTSILSALRSCVKKSKHGWRNGQREQTSYAMQYTFGMEIFQSHENLTRKRFCNSLVKPAVIFQATRYGPSRNIL